ncbi:hypothetical protein QJS10_CPA01g00588 [Acorus calamus]|uniref:Uncharacterized protein n=1 Tax=Acorus calamus TaxID=4465 RepID=A0AAV9FMR3_ACOCL|nr:hypothetical protein QJS10_CPA01g00588 [Acorus calamus]
MWGQWTGLTKIPVVLYKVSAQNFIPQGPQRRHILPHSYSRTLRMGSQRRLLEQCWILMKGM